LCTQEKNETYNTKSEYALKIFHASFAFTQMFAVKVIPPCNAGPIF